MDHTNPTTDADRRDSTSEKEAGDAAGAFGHGASGIMGSTRQRARLFDPGWA